MFSLGPGELVIILIIGLLFLGPDKLPEIGKTVGNAIREFKKGAESLQRDVEESVGLDETSREELKKALNMDEKPDVKKG